MDTNSVLLQGDCLEVLKELPDNSVDSLITDPPAGISFMSKSWDDDKGGRKQWITWMSEVMTECLRVLKPGAHGLVWAIPRTSHWTATALEDAGFEIRDVVTHLFGSGFPKSMDISKAIDKQAGAEREVIGFNPNHRKNAQGETHDTGTMVGEPHSGDGSITAPTTPEAKQWQGWGTALKPASEHWILVRKPCSEKTVAANVLEHGVGGINIDASRIGSSEKLTRPSTSLKPGNALWTEDRHSIAEIGSINGRFPANLILSHNPDCVEVGTKKVKPQTGVRKKNNSQGAGEGMFAGGLHDSTTDYVNPDDTETVSAFECTDGCPVMELDRQSGVLKSGVVKPYKRVSEEYYSGSFPENINSFEASSGGASRFFYCAKASKKDKGADNTHPTVKSSALMSYLIKLITPPGGLVLDPFMGSGSTGVAAIKNGFDFIGIEKEQEYYDISEKRISIAA